jgi:transglutaminase-like putative cysteine protease
MTAQLRQAASGWLAFGLLALYGTLRWATMVRGTARLRVFVALGVVLISAWVLGELLRRGHRRWTLVAVAGVAFIGLLALAGYPLRWLYELHTGRLAARIVHGITTLNGLLIPYKGHDPATPAVLILGGALLLLLGGLTFATVRTAPAGAGSAPATGRRALAALPLLVLAVVPSAVVTPKVGYLHGLVLATLAGALVFAPRLRSGASGARGGGLVFLALAMTIGTAAAAVIAGNHLWVQVGDGGAAGGGGSSGDVSFNWEQTYGHSWPHTGVTVLNVTAPRATYWKSEDLDTFTGTRWTQGSSQVGLLDVSAANRRRYTERISVAFGPMDSNQVVAAGYAERPQLFGTSPGSDAGTWVTNYPLEPGNSYTDNVYAPDPSAAALERAGTDYPAALAQFRSLPKLAPAYAGVEALSETLARHTDSPYRYVQAVLGYLSRGYVYTLTPPAGGAEPLADFLLRTRKGYCQQFAGATALLLRMHGIPARVAVGFTPGERGLADTYLISDSDAHAWVEVWFPRIGWVTVDPTPGTAAGTNLEATGATGNSIAAGSPGRHGSASSNLPAKTRAARIKAKQAVTHHAQGAGAAGAQTPVSAHRSGSVTLLAGLAVVGLLLLTLAAALTRSYRRRLSTAELTAELERAFLTCGRPLSEDVTLAALAERLISDPGAAAYVRTLATARFAPFPTAPSPRSRAALRRWLAHPGPGRAGVLSWLRAFAALPPRRRSATPLAP